MSVKVMAQVWELDLPQPLKLLMLALGDWADDQGGNVYPSMAYVAWKVGVSKRTAQRQMRLLERVGLVEQEGRHRLASGQHTRLLRVHPERGDKLTPLVREGVTPGPARGDTRDPKGRHSYVLQSVRDPLDRTADDFLNEELPPRNEGESWSSYLKRVASET